MNFRISFLFLLLVSSSVEAFNCQLADPQNPGPGCGGKPAAVKKQQTVGAPSWIPVLSNNRQIIVAAPSEDRSHTLSIQCYASSSTPHFAIEFGGKPQWSSRMEMVSINIDGVDDSMHVIGSEDVQTFADEKKNDEWRASEGLIGQFASGSVLSLSGWTERSRNQVERFNLVGGRDVLKAFVTDCRKLGKR